MSRFRPDIEGLRALSIALVVAYHFAGSWLPGGFVGVDVFFVISGFLITHSLLDQHVAQASLTANLLGFWARRARRLLPNALLVLAAVSVAGAWGLDDVALSRLGSDVSWAAGYAVNWLYVLRAVDYLRWGETEASVLLNYWSLAVEEQFYLVWPLLLLLPWRAGAGGRAGLRRALALAAGLGLLSLGYLLVLAQSGLALAFFSSPARAWELLAGAGLALHLRRAAAAQPAAGPALAWLGLAAVLASAVALSARSPHPGWVTLVPVLGTVLLIGGLAGAPGTALARALGSAPLRALGARSYSIYLWHWPVLTLGSAWRPERSGWQLLGWLALSLLLAEVAYRGVESPMRWHWARGAPASRVLAWALAGSLLLVATGAALRHAAEQGARGRWLPAAPRGASGLPPLQQLKADLPVVYANGCHLGVTAEVPAPGCTFGPAEAPPVLLFGDSHAAQWLPALQGAAAARGQRVVSWTKSSCPSADVTVWNPAARAPYRECDAWREAVFAGLARLGPTLVVVSNLVDDETEVIDRVDGRRLRGAAAAAAFDAGLARTLRRLVDAGLPTVLLHDTPRPRRDLLSCLYANPDATPCARPRAEAVAADPRDLRTAREAGVPAWNLDAAICGEQVCPVLVQSGRPPRLQVVYRDDNHLTASFAATLAPPLQAAWDALPPPDRGR